MRSREISPKGNTGNGLLLLKAVEYKDVENAFVNAVIQYTNTKNEDYVNQLIRVDRLIIGPAFYYPLAKEVQRLDKKLENEGHIEELITTRNALQNCATFVS